jgi:hypothetical protein
MLKRGLLLSGLLVAAIVGPIGYYNAPGYWQKVRAALTADPADTSIRADNQLLADENAPKSAQVSPATSKQATPDGTPIVPLIEALDFNITPAWVIARWPRVNTCTARLQLKGYRVPLVTGASTTDLAGSLTYYFNPAQQLQEIVLRGTTGDPTRLVDVLMIRFGFARRITNDPGLATYEVYDAAGKQRGVARIRSAPVIDATQPLRRFEVELVIQRPG